MGGNRKSLKGESEKEPSPICPISSSTPQSNDPTITPIAASATQSIDPRIVFPNVDFTPEQLEIVGEALNTVNHCSCCLSNYVSAINTNKLLPAKQRTAFCWKYKGEGGKCFQKHSLDGDLLNLPTRQETHQHICLCSFESHGFKSAVRDGLNSNEPAHPNAQTVVLNSSSQRLPQNTPPWPLLLGLSLLFLVLLLIEM